MPLVSIIIPVVKINKYIRESITHVKSMDFKDYEVVVFPDLDTGCKLEKIRVIPTGKIGPAEKRDLAMKYAKGEILAFLDDDAYPDSGWLKNAVRHFNTEKIFAVGGPAITPPTDSFWQRVSGAVFLSKAGGGNPERYWPTGNIREVDDWPSVNLFVKKHIFIKIGGFKSEYWPGEDTKLCLDLIKAGGKILYDPSVKVWHHRRSGIIKHLKQVGNYGLHRGFFAKRYPENSLKLKYFTPSFFIAFIVASVICVLFFKSIARIMIYGYIAYMSVLLYGLIDIYRKEKNIVISFFAVIYIVFTHLWYGIRFFEGFLFKKKLKSKLRETN